jgi:hypothetical protein
MKTIKVNRVLLDSINITDEAIKNYPDETFKKLESILADVTKNNILCDSLGKYIAQFQCAKGYSVGVLNKANVRIFEFYHDEVVIE